MGATKKKIGSSRVNWREPLRVRQGLGQKSKKI